MVRLLTENIRDDVFEVFENAETAINIISPFIGYETAKELVKIKKEKNVSINLITKFSSADFFAKASSIDAIKLLHENGIEIRAVKKLHTKLYLIDSYAMILGSSNFTRGGFVTNIELNVLFENTSESDDYSEIIGKGRAYFDELKTRIPEKFIITGERIENEIAKFERNRNMQQRGLTFPKTDDFGYEFTETLDSIKFIDVLENCFLGADDIHSAISTSWIKFEGYSDSRRTKPHELITKELENGKFKTHFSTKPTGFKTGDLVFLGLLSYDEHDSPTVMIYGYGTVRKWEENQVMTPEEIEKDENGGRWRYYIYIENVRYIHDEVCNCVPFYDLTTNVGTNAFPKSVGTDRDVRNIHQQKEKLRITEAAKNYLLAELAKRGCK